MKLGFSGTRHGMTEPQADTVLEWLLQIHPTEVHHGACEGADEQFEYLVRRIQGVCVVHAWPGFDSNRQSPHRGQVKPDVWHPEMAYHKRNARIVQATDMLLATPSHPVEQVRSGTWATIRVARRERHPIAIIFPDGTSTYDKADSPS